MLLRLLGNEGINNHRFLYFPLLIDILLYFLLPTASLHLHPCLITFSMLNVSMNSSKLLSVTTVGIKHYAGLSFLKSAIITLHTHAWTIMYETWHLSLRVESRDYMENLMKRKFVLKRQYWLW
jgi:hypothetical protein